MNNKVLIPLKMEISPIKKLFLLNFEKHPEKVYEGLEWQYLESEEIGTGYRIIAYRTDKYVDVYDDINLKIENAGNFEVCGKGLLNYRECDFTTKCFEKEGSRIRVEFSFEDYLGRKIEVKIRESRKKESKSFDLIAPVGTSSVNPVMLPMFAMYNFDLVRVKETEVIAKINEKNLILDLFPIPFPKDFQKRYFARYGYDCELVEFAHSGREILLPVEIDKNGCILQNGVLHSFQKQEGGDSLQSMKFKKAKHRFELIFSPPIPDIMGMKEEKKEGEFIMEMDSTLGKVTGNYLIERQEDEVKIEMVPSGGWDVVSGMLLTKLLFQKKSLFCTWPKTYQYTQKINIRTGESVSKWKRI